MAIRVGRYVERKGKREYPSFPGFTPIVVLTKSSRWGSLGPYVLKDEKDRIFENIWQGSKVYPEVPPVRQTYSRWDPTVIWEHPGEIHVIQHADYDELTPAYFQWREKLFSSPYPVRWPVGYSTTWRSKCLYALAEDEKGEIEDEPLDYIEARKRIYAPLYLRLVRQEMDYHRLQEKLAQGENLLVIEVDGPHQESLDYYREKYHVGEEFIKDNTMLATSSNLKIMLDDPRHPFGHGYCLALGLLGLDHLLSK